MSSTHFYSSKAESYARYRWHYAPAAVDALCEIAGLNAASRVSDIGAGTGILTRCLAGRAGYVLGVEPDLQMLRAAQMPADHACGLAAGCAEALPLANGWADVLTAAQAVHWFQPLPARAEFTRVLRPGGWLALLRNRSIDSEQDQALAGLSRPEYGYRAVSASQPALNVPSEFWFGAGAVQRHTFAFSFRQSWEGYLGALCSASYMPEEEDPLFPRLEQAAWAVFERFAVDGQVEVRGETELLIGQPA